MKKKAQAAVMGLLFAFILVATFAIIIGPLIEFVNIGVNGSQNFTHSALMTTIIQIMPVFIALVVLIAIVALITGRQS